MIAISFDFVIALGIAIFICVCAITLSSMLARFLNKDNTMQNTGGYECGFQNLVKINFKDQKQKIVVYFLIIETLILFCIFLKLVCCAKILLLPLLAFVVYLIFVIYKKCILH